MPSVPLRARPARPAWLAALLILAGLALYAPSLGAPFVFDDLPQIVENPRLRDPWPLGRLVAGTTRPILDLSFAASLALGGADARGFRLANVAVHALAALALFGVLRRTLGTDRFPARVQAAASGLAFAGALLWMIHPLQTAAVTYVFQRAESLMGLFFLLSLYAAIRGAEGPHRRAWNAGAVIAAALALGTKEVAVALPFVLLVHDRTFLAGSFGAALRRRPGLYAALGALWIAFAASVLDDLVRPGSMAGFRGPGVSPLAYAAAQPGVVVHYLRLAGWPRELCLDYGWPPAAAFREVGPALGFVATLLAGTIWALCRRHWLGAAGAWFFLVLAPTSSFLPIRDLAFEHRMYLPLAAPIAVAVAAVYAILGRLRRGGGPLAVFALALAAMALAAGTLARNREFASPVALWETVVARAPANPRGHLQLGVARAAEGRLAEAAAAYEDVLALRPDDVAALTNLGGVLLRRNELGRAIDCFRRAAEIDPAPVHHTNLGHAWRAAQEWEEAVAAFRRALAVRPDFAPAQAGFATALFALGRPSEAILHYELALAAAPDDAATLENLGHARRRAGDEAGAREAWHRVLELAPDGATRERMLELLASPGRGSPAVDATRGDG
ncbi:MAG: tetratricopeptide repeat protein [Planctomycetota bacterium]